MSLLKNWPLISWPLHALMPNLWLSAQYHLMWLRQLETEYKNLNLAFLFYQLLLSINNRISHKLMWLLMSNFQFTSLHTQRSTTNCQWNAIVTVLQYQSAIRLYQWGINFQNSSFITNVSRYCYIDMCELISNEFLWWNVWHLWWRFDKMTFHVGSCAWHTPAMSTCTFKCKLFTCCRQQLFSFSIWPEFITFLNIVIRFFFTYFIHSRLSRYLTHSILNCTNKTVLLFLRPQNSYESGCFGLILNITHWWAC